jgi:hypothetical protein
MDDNQITNLANTLTGGTEDPVQQTQNDIALLQQQIASGQFAGSKLLDLKLSLIDKQRELRTAMQEARAANFDLRRAELEAMGDDVGAAQLSVQEARQQLAEALALGDKANMTEVARLRAGVVRAETRARETLFSEKMDDYKFLFDMGQITKFQYVQYLEGLKSTLIPGTKQFKELELQIKQLKDTIGNDLQFNLPTALALPTLYEVRRMNSDGPSNAAPMAMAQSSYAPSVTVNVGNINNGVDANNMIQAIKDVVDPSRNGYGPRRY